MWPRHLSSRWLVYVVETSLLLGCVQNQPYRLGGIDDTDYHNQKPCFDEVEVAKGRTYRLSFVEFDEKGDFWDRRQLGKASRRMSKTKQPVLLVIYIHGWHHNANDRAPGGKNPGDVETFRCLLSELAISATIQPLQVHGVYLGWRGRLVQGPLDYLTFLGRKNAATRVAGTPVTETIFELIRQARRASREAKCVVIGHSFGGLVLEKAMAQALTGSVLAQDVQTGGGPLLAPADLILLVNSAAESIYAKEMSEMFDRIGHRDSVDPHRPLLIQITSKTDTATSGWFPRGTFLPNLFAHRIYHWDQRFDSLSHEVDQNEYLTTTPGHNERLWTHDIKSIAQPADAPSPQAIENMAQRLTHRDCREEEESNPAFEENLQHPRGLIFATPGTKALNTFQWWEIVPRYAGQHANPYWIVHVPGEIIPGHTPIFTPAGRALMAALFRITNKSATGSRKLILNRVENN